MAKKKSRKGLWITLISIAAVIVLAGGSVALWYALTPKTTPIVGTGGEITTSDITDFNTNWGTFKDKTKWIISNGGFWSPTDITKQTNDNRLLGIRLSKCRIKQSCYNAESIPLNMFQAGESYQIKVGRYYVTETTNIPQTLTLTLGLIHPKLATGDTNILISVPGNVAQTTLTGPVFTIPATATPLDLINYRFQISTSVAANDTANITAMDGTIYLDNITITKVAATATATAIPTVAVSQPAGTGQLSGPIVIMDGFKAHLYARTPGQLGSQENPFTAKILKPFQIQFFESSNDGVTTPSIHLLMTSNVINYSANDGKIKVGNYSKDARCGSPVEKIPCESNIVNVVDKAGRTTKYYTLTYDLYATEAGNYAITFSGGSFTQSYYFKFVE
jgi:hypothetical protein